MTKILLAIGVVIAAAAAATAQETQVPAPGAEQKNLAYFEGTWKVEGTMQASAFGPAGAMTGTETCRMFEGGWHLVCDSQGAGPMGPMKSHTLMTYDHAVKQYRYFSVSNLPEAEMAAGDRKEGVWQWLTDVTLEGKKIQSRFIMNQQSPSSYTMKWETSIDGTTWQLVFEGKGTKTSS